MIFGIEATAPIETKAIDGNKRAVDGYLAEGVDDCQLVTVMTPRQMNQLVLIVCSSDTVYHMFFAHPPLSIRRITHQVTYNHIASIASDVRNAAISRPNQFSILFLEIPKQSAGNSQRTGSIR